MLANATSEGASRAQETDFGALFRVTETYRAGAEGQQKTSALLHAFASLLEDLLLLQAGTGHLMRNIDLKAELTRIAQTVDVAWIENAVRGMDQVEQGMRRNLLQIACSGFVRCRARQGVDDTPFHAYLDSQTQRAASCILISRLHNKTMADSSAIPAPRIYDARQAKAKSKADGTTPSILPSISPTGPRKLIRPPLPLGTGRYPARVSAISPAFTHHARSDSAAVRGDSSHAEAFYFQKQIHSRTLMIFVLEDGEQIEGMIEWYDRHAIKVRHGNLRTLIYKAGIKYLYKAADSNQLNGRP